MPFKSAESISDYSDNKYSPSAVTSLTAHKQDIPGFYGQSPEEIAAWRQRQINDAARMAIANTTTKQIISPQEILLRVFGE